MTTNQQPGLKITAQGIVPDWFQKALSALKERKNKRKRESQQAADQRDFITQEKVLEHFSAAEAAGVWSR